MQFDSLEYNADQSWGICHTCIMWPDYLHNVNFVRIQNLSCFISLLSEAQMGMQFDSLEENAVQSRGICHTCIMWPDYCKIWILTGFRICLDLKGFVTSATQWKWEFCQNSEYVMFLKVCGFSSTERELCSLTFMSRMLINPGEFVTLALCDQITCQDSESVETICRVHKLWRTCLGMV